MDTTDLITSTGKVHQIFFKYRAAQITTLPPLQYKNSLSDAWTDYAKTNRPVEPEFLNYRYWRETPKIIREEDLYAQNHENNERVKAEWLTRNFPVEFTYNKRSTQPKEWRELVDPRHVFDNLRNYIHIELRRGVEPESEQVSTEPKPLHIPWTLETKPLHIPWTLETKPKMCIWIRMVGHPLGTESQVYEWRSDVLVAAGLIIGYQKLLQSWEYRYADNDSPWFPCGVRTALK